MPRTYEERPRHRSCIVGRVVLTRISHAMTITSMPQIGRFNPATNSQSQSRYINVIDQLIDAISYRQVNLFNREMLSITNQCFSFDGLLVLVNREMPHRQIQQMQTSQIHVR